MRSPDCVIIFHSNRSVEVEPLLLIILKTDFLSRNDQSILNIYSLILSKKNKPSEYSLSTNRDEEKWSSLYRCGESKVSRDNKRDSAQCQISLLYRFVRRNVFQSQVGWEPRHREFEVDSSSIKCETGKFATREI